jgi:cold-inducible RNA-binding protein
MATKSLYVGNLPYSTTEEALVEYFAAYGGRNARIVEGRGFGFVDVDEDKLEAAIAEKHGTELDGRTLTVNEARPREERAPRPSYGGGRSDDRGGGGGGRGGRPGGKKRGF